MGGIGGFGGLFDLGALAYDDPVLVSSTDGVGTKSVVAWSTGRYDTIGIDLVGTADDIAAQGAEPLFFFDYLSMGRLDPQIAATIVGGVAEGCRRAGAALLGGEMSEHPQLMGAGEFDLVGFAVGAVERDAVLPRDVAIGDVLMGIESPGLRCNGYTLARRALLDAPAAALDEPAWPGADATLADELLRPSVIYAPTLAALARRSMCTPSRTSPAAGSRATSTGCSRPTETRASRAGVGRSRGSSPRCSARARSPTRRWSPCSTSVSGWSLRPRRRRGRGRRGGRTRRRVIGEIAPGTGRVLLGRAGARSARGLGSRSLGTGCAGSPESGRLGMCQSNQRAASQVRRSHAGQRASRECVRHGVHSASGRLRRTKST